MWTDEARRAAAEARSRANGMSDVAAQPGMSRNQRINTHNDAGDAHVRASDASRAAGENDKAELHAQKAAGHFATAATLSGNAPSAASSPRGADKVYATHAGSEHNPATHAGSEHGPDLALQRAAYRWQSAEFHKKHPEIDA